jgi:hypothetical protein
VKVGHNFDGLAVASRIRLVGPRQGVAEAYLKLCSVSNVEYLRRTMHIWSSWTIKHKVKSSLFNWVSISNFNTARNTRIYCLDSTGEPVVLAGLQQIVYSGLGPEALMFISDGKVVRCDAGHRVPLIYIGFLEVAPWNHPDVPSRSFKRLGLLLLKAACRISAERGYQGRLGLHATAKAENFYSRLGFRSLDCPNEYNELYMELDEGRALTLLGDGGDSQ